MSDQPWKKRKPYSFTSNKQTAPECRQIVNSTLISALFQRISKYIHIYIYLSTHTKTQIHTHTTTPSLNENRNDATHVERALYYL